MTAGRARSGERFVGRVAGRGRRCWSRGFAEFGLRGFVRGRGGGHLFLGLVAPVVPAVEVDRRFATAG